MVRAVQEGGENTPKLTPAQEQAKIKAVKIGFEAAQRSLNNALKAKDTKRAQAAINKIIELQREATFGRVVASATATLEMNKFKDNLATIVEQATANVEAAKQDVTSAQANQASAAANVASSKTSIETAKALVEENKKLFPDAAAQLAAKKAEEAAKTAAQKEEDKKIADAKAAELTKIANEKKAKAEQLAKDAEEKKAKAEELAKIAAQKVADAKAKDELDKKKVADQIAADALLADQLKSTAETKAALAKALEDLRLQQEASAAAQAEAAKLAAANAKTAEDLAAAQRALDAANAETAAAEAAGKAAVDAALANINQSGDVALPGTSIADAASAMYAKELELKEKNDAALAKRTSVIDTLTARFAEYGIPTLAEEIKKLAINDANEATITLGLQQTQAYQDRFKANKVRLEKGLRVLQPDEYLSSERAYKQTLNTYGLGQFDEYVNTFLENDTSATEINTRIVTAATRVQNTDPTIIKTLKDFYGLEEKDLVAYVLDTKTQLPEILKKVSAAEVGAAARAQGLNAGTTEEELAGYAASAGSLVAQGVTQAEAQANYSKIAEFLPTAEKLSDIYGSTVEGYDLKKAEEDYFGGLASAKRAKEQLRVREIGAFSGSAGTTKGSLGSSNKGQI
jgi:hypothetical protein